MSGDNSKMMSRAARQWLKARDIIARALWEWRTGATGVSDQDRERAAAILARLAGAGLLLCEADDLKDE